MRLLGSFGRVLGTSWGCVGGSWGHFGSSWSPLGVILAAPEGFLGRSGQPLRRYVKHSKTRVFYVVLAAPGPLRGCQKGSVEAPEAQVGVHGASVEVHEAQVEVPRVVLDGSWGHSGSSWSTLGVILAAPGGLLGRSGQPLRRYVKHSKTRVFYVVLAPPGPLRGCQKGSVEAPEAQVGVHTSQVALHRPFWTPCGVPRASAT